MTPKKKQLVVMAENASACTACSLHEDRTNSVFHRGSPDADIMFIGEAPGATEDEKGIPFVGDAGKMLDRMIAAMDLDPWEEAYICNAVKCRPPNNRTPSEDELSSCSGLLYAQIRIVNPKIIVALGKTAVRSLSLHTGKGWRGMWGYIGFGTSRYPVMPTYHPAYLLRNPNSKKVVAGDLSVALHKLNNLRALDDGGCANAS